MCSSCVCVLLGRETMAEERARLKALRANDMEGYKKLLEKTKNDRLVFLMQQTDEYLAKLGRCHTYTTHVAGPPRTPHTRRSHATHTPMPIPRHPCGCCAVGNCWPCTSSAVAHMYPCSGPCL